MINKVTINNQNNTRNNVSFGTGYAKGFQDFIEKHLSEIDEGVIANIKELKTDGRPDRFLDYVFEEEPVGMMMAYDSVGNGYPAIAAKRKSSLVLRIENAVYLVASVIKKEQQSIATQIDMKKLMGGLNVEKINHAEKEAVPFVTNKERIAAREAADFRARELKQQKKTNAKEVLLKDLFA